MSAYLYTYTRIQAVACDTQRKFNNNFRISKINRIFLCAIPIGITLDFLLILHL